MVILIGPKKKGRTNGPSCNILDRPQLIPMKHETPAHGRGLDTLLRSLRLARRDSNSQPIRGVGRVSQSVRSLPVVWGWGCSSVAVAAGPHPVCALQAGLSVNPEVV